MPYDPDCVTDVTIKRRLKVSQDVFASWLKCPAFPKRLPSRSLRSKRAMRLEWSWTEVLDWVENHDVMSCNPEVSP